MHYDVRLKHIVELGLPPFAQAVMIALNRYANHKTHQCRPSLEKLAQRAVMHRNTVWKTIKALEKVGHLSIESGEGDYTVSTYTLLPRMLEVTSKVTQQVTSGVTKPTTTTARRKFTKADFAKPAPPGWCQRCKLLPAATEMYCLNCYRASRKAEDRELKHMQRRKELLGGDQDNQRNDPLPF